MSLEAKQLTFGYRGKGRKQVLDGLDLTVAPGERVGLAGPSGRGKTTLCKLLAGYEKPDSGTVLVDGKPLREYRGICPVQMIWQHPETAVDPLMKLGDTLKEGGPVEEGLLEALHIQPAWLERYPTELSGGELQRFCIARALRPGVKYLLCDEVTAMLDLITQAQIWAFLLEQAEKRDLGLVIVSHNSALLEQLCTRVQSLV
ncbi:ABC transporter ATP-binding protein [Flavonifractor sp. An82]|uniref:ABC transporter ATP-binding protein n=1 Tax=Flavonifractor sp. An82 TaxID=1965660 RepID=UPI000B391F91|nr:ATP-binding cassette domain-containing protein [Flavonifractor sp. An82]OUN20756.1 ABC transporter ATP-binding protein [Flavonifractor sp. An82]